MSVHYVHRTLKDRDLAIHVLSSLKSRKNDFPVFFGNFTFQFIVGWAVVVLGPFFLRYGFTLQWAAILPHLQGLLITSIAYLAGFGLLSQMSHYPGATGNAYILPVYCLTFGIAFLAIVGAGLDVSRVMIFGGAGLSVIWSYGTGWLSRHSRRMTLGVVPYGEFNILPRSSHIDWVKIDSPKELPAGVSAVVADLRSDMPAEWTKFLAECALASIPVYHTKQLIESVSGRVPIEHLSENFLGSLLPSGTYRVVKRLIDIFGVLFTAPITLPLMLVASVLIKIEDGGPVIFSQKRLGFRGKPFNLYKLRTMREVPNGSAFTVDGDSRITKVGHFLRKYRVDELPQVFNILKGEMSWIGPRPESVSLCEWHEKEIPFYSYRHTVYPGISGWAQVTQGAGTGIEEVTEKLQFDFYYIKHFSPWLDLLIVFKTLRVIFSGFGAR